MQSFDLRPELFEAALVPQHVIGMRHPRLGGRLRGETAARRLGVDAALDGAPQPQLGIGFDRDHDVVTIGPAGLDQQGRLHHDDAACGLEDRPVALADQWMDRRFERAPRRRVGEDQGAELLVIDAAPLVEHAGAEEAGDRGRPRGARLVEIGHDAIGVDHRAAELREPARHRRLAAGEAAGEADGQPSGLWVGARLGSRRAHFESRHASLSRGSGTSAAPSRSGPLDTSAARS